MNNQQKSIVIIDFINEIIDSKGKLAGKGYAAFDAKHGTLDNVKKLQEFGRRNHIPILFVRVGFSSSYVEHPENSPLFGGAKKFGALQLGTSATEFHPKVAPISGETIITKHRVSAFYGTSLELILKNLQVKEVLLAGVATDLAVQAAARDAHDRDFAVTVVSDCCAAANEEDHELSIKTIAKIAKIITLSDLT